MTKRNNMAAIKDGANRMGMFAKEKTTNVRLNHAVNTKLSQPFKTLKQQRQVAIQQLIAASKDKTLDAQTFDVLVHRFETQLIANVNEALRNMVVDFMSDALTQKLTFDSDLIHDVHVTTTITPMFVKLAPNSTGKSISNATKRAILLQAGQVAITQAAKLRKKAPKTTTTKLGGSLTKGLVIDAAVAGVGLVAEIVEQNMLARKQFNLSGLDNVYQDVVQQVAKQVTDFKKSLQRNTQQLQLSSVSTLINEANDDTK